MTHKKEWRWFLNPRGNAIFAISGRMDLLEVDPVDKLPIRDKLPSWLKGEMKEVVPIDIMEKPEVIKPETFFQRLKRKYHSVIDLAVGIVDLFTKGAASKIENSIDAILTDDTENKNIISNKNGDVTMLDTIQNFIVGMIFRWIMKIGGTFLVSAGFSSADLTQKLTEIIGGFVAIGIGIVVSLFQHKKALETDLKTVQK